jgi:succinate dehydrogenase / fumarate reductase iron-sulfur subunit
VSTFKEYIFHVLRYDSSTSAPAAFKTYTVPYRLGLTVLGGLLQIQEKQDGSISFRSSCRSAVCGSCGMLINGKFDLACRTQLSELSDPQVTLEPLPNLEVLKDLVVDMAPFWQSYRSMEPWLHAKAGLPAKESLQTEEQRSKIDQYVNCILCACCYGACPVAGRNPDYKGPAALTKLARFLNDTRDERSGAFLDKVSGESGIWGCDTVLRCIDACPKDVAPAYAIENLRRKQVGYKVKKVFGLGRSK